MSMVMPLERGKDIMIDPQKQARFDRYKREIVILLMEGRRYRALLLLRQITGLGLEESNDLLDGLCAEPGDEGITV